MTISLLRLLSVVYLLLPTLIFSAAWFRNQYSLLLVAGYGYVAFQETRKRFASSDKLGPSDIIFLAVFALLWTCCTGIAGFTFQTYDYWAHNSKYYDLITNSWPIYFPEKNSFACYYFGYYLVPAFISKCTHTLSEPALFIWSALGFFLGLAWIYILINKNRFLLLLFLCLGGIGHTVKILASQLTLYKFHYPGFVTEVWSTFDQSLWVSNQVIPSLIVVGILIYDTFVRNRIEESFLIITLTFVWAIFPAIVLTVLYGIIFIKKFVDRAIPLTWASFFTNCVVPGLLFLPTFLYLVSSSQTPISGFIWQFGPVFDMLLSHMAGIVLDGLFYYLIYSLFRKEISRTFPVWFVHTVFGLFIAMSFYRIGVMNDWIMRGSIPLISLISVLILKGVSQRMVSKELLRINYLPVLLVFVLLCALSPLSNVKRALVKNIVISKYYDGVIFTPIPYDQFTNTYTLLKVKYSEKEANQYLGKRNSVYEFYLSRQPFNW